MPAPAISAPAGAARPFVSSHGASLRSVLGWGRRAQARVSATVAMKNQAHLRRGRVPLAAPTPGGGVVAATGAIGGGSVAQAWWGISTRASCASAVNVFAACPTAGETRRNSPSISAWPRGGNSTTWCSRTGSPEASFARACSASRRNRSRRMPRRGGKWTIRGAAGCSGADPGGGAEGPPAVEDPEYRIDLVGQVGQPCLERCDVHGELRVHRQRLGDAGQLLHAPHGLQQRTLRSPVDATLPLACFHEVDAKLAVLPGHQPPERDVTGNGAQL